jgi:hypothetical protein
MNLTANNNTVVPPLKKPPLLQRKIGSYLRSFSNMYCILQFLNDLENSKNENTANRNTFIANNCYD